jgi:hypothetical protein
MDTTASSAGLTTGDLSSLRQELENLNRRLNEVEQRQRAAGNTLTR